MSEYPLILQMRQFIDEERNYNCGGEIYTPYQLQAMLSVWELLSDETRESLKRLAPCEFMPALLQVAQALDAMGLGV